jgi:hypothetical protein
MTQISDTCPGGEEKREADEKLKVLKGQEVGT